MENGSDGNEYCELSLKTGFRKRGISDARRRKIGRKGTREEEERYEGTRRKRGGKREEEER